MIYGYPSNDEACEKIKLEPVAKLKSKISFLKEIDENYSIGYGRSFISNKNMKIATVGIGYADGYRRCLSNKGKVVIKNTLCDVVGKVCMDSIMVDVTNVENVHINDDVYIFDNKLITIEQLAKQCDTINYEILSTIGERVPRIFVVDKFGVKNNS